jgi:glycosyltransferase involved in cell wall biosynthesis
MIKIYLPNNSRPQLGGGWTFLSTFKKYASRAGVEFVSTWQECDVVLVSGVTLVDPDEIAQAKLAGKPIIFRVGNVPRKSRNRRNTPSARMKEIAEISDVVIHQSEWSKRYCMPLVGDGPVIYNGVDTEIFTPVKEKPDHERWLFAYHNKNETKNFWTAYFMFQNRFRENPNAEFWFVYDFGRDQEELEKANYDFWNGEKFLHVPRPETPETMAALLCQCTHYVHPAVADACPNQVLEARACGLEVIGYANDSLAGTYELLNPKLDISAKRMVEEYLGVIKLVLSNTQIGG